MPVSYCSVSVGKCILVKYAGCEGNFEDFTQQILPKIPSHNHSDTYTYIDYRFYYICTASIIFLCITDLETTQKTAFAFLETIKQKFESQYDSSTIPPLPYSLQDEFSGIIKNFMNHFNKRFPASIQKVEEQVDQLKSIMSQSIDQLINRGERLELLVNKSQNLSENSVTFKRTSVVVKKQQCSKNLKVIIMTSLFALVFLYAVISVACGGLDWNGCISKNDGSNFTAN